MERKEAIEVIKKNWPDNSFTMLREALETVIPELKESEDERIRKAIKLLVEMKENDSLGFEPVYGASYKEIRSWLEKQGEQKSNDISPIFRVGDYIRNKKTGDKVLIEQLDIATKAYCYVSYDGGAETHSDFSFSKQDEWMLIGQNIVEQKPAWSGKDSCCYDDICEILINLIYSPKSNVNKDVVQRDLNWIMSIKEKICPQNKQNCNNPIEINRRPLKKNEVKVGDIITYFRDGKKGIMLVSSFDAGIYPRCKWGITDIDGTAYGDWNPGCAEYYAATEEEIYQLYNTMPEYVKNWLKSLKERVQPQPKQEWSEEDEKLYTWCASAIQTRYNDGLFTMDEYRETSLWLKSLKERLKGE